MKTIKMLSSRVSGLALPAVLAIAAVVGASAATANNSGVSKFGVRVLNDAGQPVTGASVCVGLPGNYKQFGALFTDADGKAFVDVPNVPLIVTVSKTRFSGMRISEPARRFNLLKDVTLAEGIPGPRCRAGSTVAEGNSSITIAHVDVMEGKKTTRLLTQVVGQPSHYRVSDTASFANAKWQPFSSDIPLSSSLTKGQEVFLQMRRFEGTAKSWLEARSAVVTVSLPHTH